MPALILHIDTPRKTWWLEQLQQLLPELDCRPWETPGDVNDIEIAVVWKQPAGSLQRFPNLKCIVSMGAGIDHVLADPHLPANVPLIRTTGADLTLRMREYVCLQVLKLHRGSNDLEVAQHQKKWRPVITPPAHERCVGIMGLGKLGSDAARQLATMGFNVSGWASSQHDIKNVTTFTGSAQRDRFLQQCEILVCMLPLTSLTRNILDQALFSTLPKGASIINVARGEHLVEEDLLEALDKGHLQHATLDVFRSEPLPQSHPFWSHPQISVTPHVASIVDPVSGGQEIANNIRRFINGESLTDTTDPKRGY